MRILMVCLGNICRSPLAEGIMQKKSQVEGLNWDVDSAGVLSYHQGSPPQPGSLRIAMKYGIDISQQQSRPFITKDFENFDLIFTMDWSVHESILNLTDDPNQKSKVHMLLEYSGQTDNLDVRDPYKESDDVFDDVYKVIDEACGKIIKRLNSYPLK
jgi:protein-tyrosine phosphatase